MKFCAAIDLGASSGRVSIGSLEGSTLQIQEVHRFKHEAHTHLDGALRWEWDTIVEEVIRGLHKAQEFGEIVSIGIDTWAVDYGLLDSNGNLIEQPYCYRDSRTDGLMRSISDSLGAEWIYQRTGIQFIFFNTAYQLHAARMTESLKNSDTFLLLPDLLNYHFSGVKSCDVTNASTTQLLNAHSQEWDWELVEKLEIPGRIFPPLHKAGTKIGVVSGHGTLDGISVVGVGSHDTASAVAGVPLNPDRSSAYISSGTWSLVGLELDSPVTDTKALSYNITNEVGVADRIRFIKNVSGMWLLEESLRYWKSMGHELSAAQLAHDAQNIPPQQIIDTNDPRFAKPGAMPERIAEYCRETNQTVPSSPAEIARCIFDSLAAAYARSLAELEDAAQVKITELDIVGGGSSNDLLNQLTANATGLKVIAGPVEATVMGNLIIQMMSAGWIASLEEGRSLISKSVERKVFLPKVERG